MHPARHTRPDFFSISRAGAEDCAGILECLAMAFAPYRASYTPAALLDTILTPQTIGERLADMTVFVAKSNRGRVVGTIACKLQAREHGHLRGMAVVPQLHGSGIGQRLLETAEDELRKAGCTAVTLDTTEPLERAIRFYENNGYRRTGRVHDFFGMPLFEYSKTLARAAESHRDRK
jgi:ribosomal protein S18 acetylase RimI-like enzyme